MVNLKGGLLKFALAVFAAVGFLVAVGSTPGTGNLHGAVNASAGGCDGYYSDSVPPNTIKVLVHSSDGTASVQTVPFEPYVENVLPNEWVPGWDAEALKAGAIAAKMYAWYWVNQGGKSQYATNYTGPCYDVQDNTNDQVYVAGSAQPSTTAAVQATWSTNALENGHVFQAHYCSNMNCGYYPFNRSAPNDGQDLCGTDPSGTPNTTGLRLSQYGSQACAQAGLTYQQILNKYYYPGLSFTTSVAPVPVVAAFQAAGQSLWTVGSSGSTNWGVQVAPATTPSVTTLPSGGFEVAFQAAGQSLWTVGNGGWTNWGVQVAPGTSPAIAALRNGGFEVAFQAAGQSLWTVGNGGWTNWGVQVASGTSPALVTLPSGGFEVAFQAAGQSLWTVGNGGWTNWGVQVAPRTSPAIVALPSGGFEVAFQAAGGVLWTTGVTGTTNWGLPMAPGTSPGITIGAGGLLEAYQGSDGDLWTVSSGGYGWNLGIAPGTSVGVR